MKKRPAAAMAAAALALSGCTLHGTAGTGGSSPHPPASTPATHTAAPHTVPAAPSGALRKVHDPGQVTGSYPGRCTARDSGQLPDQRCTPGAVDPAVTQADIGSTVCVSGYTARIRPPEPATERFKWDVSVPGYGLPQSFHGELDHLVPLELGGANDASNLWPEAGSLPNAKDSVEGALHRAVCDGCVALGAAQRAIAGDWKTAEQQLGVSGAR